MSDDSFTTICRNVSKVINSLIECLEEFQSRVLCFDQINFINRVGMSLVMKVRNDLVVANFSDQVLSCFSEVARLTFNRILLGHFWELE